MKYLISLFLALIMISINTISALAVGDVNVDNGGGSLGTGTSSNYWNAGNDGVRVTVVRSSDRAVVEKPIDLTNKSPIGVVHFNKVSKIQYSNGAIITPSFDTYIYYNPAQAVPKIMSSKSLGTASIDEIKSYFTDEQVIRSIADKVSMDFEILINGDYKLLIEPIVYVTYENVFIAMTATEAALYDELTGGAVRSKLPTVAFQNLPLERV